MLLAHKRLSEITENDLMAFVNSAAESETTEFTLEMWGRGSDPTRDMLREIGSFANHRGGELYVGIAERDGTAHEIVGIEAAGVAERIVSSCASNFDRTLIGLDVHPVPLSNGRSVVVVRIPLSLAGPHMITHEGLNQFWIRRGRQKDKMTQDEIEAAYLRKFDSESRTERFIRDRVRLHMTEDMNFHWSVTPLFLRDEILNPLDDRLQLLLQMPPRHPAVDTGATLLQGAAIFPSLYGSEAVMSIPDTARTAWRIEVHRTGHIELVIRNAWFVEEDHGNREIWPKTPVLETWRFLQLAKIIYERAGFRGPVVVGMSLTRSASSFIHHADRVLMIRGPFRQTAAILELPLLTSQDFGQDVPRLTKLLTDRLWNAYRQPSCPHVTDEGELWPRGL